MSQQPYMPLFFGDLLAATPTWEGEERALYVLLLAYQWAAGPLPTDPKRLAKMCQYEAKTFTALWQVVGQKFTETPAGLVNPRLEQHREKAQELSAKNSASGSKGGRTTWERKRQREASERSSERSSENPSAGDSERSSERHEVRLSNPIQSNPTHTSNPSGSQSHARETEGDWTEFQAFREAYPGGIFPAVAWQYAERAWLQLRDEGETAETLLAAAKGYAAQQFAAGKLGTQWIKRPDGFLTSGQWRGPFPLPAAAAEPKRETANDRIDRALAAKAAQRAASAPIETEVAHGRLAHIAG